MRILARRRSESARTKRGPNAMNHSKSHSDIMCMTMPCFRVVHSCTDTSI